MITKKMIWGLVPMAAALMLTACSNNDIETVAEKPAKKIIPFTATVSTENVKTRLAAGESSGAYNLTFTSGDKLEVYSLAESPKLEGTLNINPDDAGKTAATFTGNLTYEAGTTDPATPAADLEIIVQLTPEGSSPFEIYANVTDAIQKGSMLVNQIKYSELSSFSFIQATGFIDFEITLSGDHAPVAGANVDIAVSGTVGNSYVADRPLSFSGSSTVTSDGKVKFAIPVSASVGESIMTLKDAKLTITEAVGASTPRYTGSCDFADGTGFQVFGKVYTAARTISSWTEYTPAAIEP